MSEAKKRKFHTPEFKAKVALEALRGVKTINEIGQEFGVHPITVGHWKKELQAEQDGSTNRAEGHTEGVEDQADDCGGQGREAQGQEQGSGQSGGCAETGGAFDEGREHVADDDGLNALVTADVLHPVLDGFHAP